ncbi:carbohydrate-binding module family 35 protein [Plicaturopsis crispa FD-325 SS-3]|nr:carbohydrate-binding module family 35 protein [Plicaturopsis crispa FD-325 SS-3]
MPSPTIFRVLAAFLGISNIAFSYAVLITPGAPWKDTDGNAIQAHGGGFLKVNDTYYWHGEDKTANSALFHAVSCYSSTDFGTWTREVDALTPVANTLISSSNIVERPKVIYNEKNSEYVMWFHSDDSNYGLANVGVATAKTPCGPYTFKASWQPLKNDSRDMGLFQDDDQSAYLLYASYGNTVLKITQLDDDYYNVTTEKSEIVSRLEAPGIVKRDSIYYLFASHQSGWSPNANKYFHSTSLSGPWTTEADLADPSLDTYNSQNSFDLPLGSEAVYLGDRWRSGLLGSSTYIWLPLSWASGEPQLVQADVWDLDIAAGTYKVYSGTSYNATDGTVSGNAKINTASHFVNGIGAGGSVTIEDVTGTGANQWIGVYYSNSGSWTSTTISVNGGSTSAVTPVDQSPTSSNSTFIGVPVNVYLEKGANNLTFGTNQTSPGGNLGWIVVYDV